jgi:hypothetical protein
MAKRTGTAIEHSPRAARTARPAEGRDEWEAAWIVSESLGGIPRRRGGPGHDYDIEVGLRLVALEVTKSAPQERNALNAAIRRLHEREITCTTTHWQLTIPDAREGYPGPPLHPIFDEAPPHLRLLEEHGVWGFGPGHEWQCLEAPEAVQACIAELFALGLISGNSVGPLMPKDRPLLLVGTRGEGSILDANDVNNCVERAAARKARQLLAATHADERHLFVVVECTDYAASAALTAGLRLPDRPPKVPVGIDTVWVGAWMPRAVYGCDISPIWQVRPPDPWVRVQVHNPHAYAAHLGDDAVLSAEEEGYEVVRQTLNEHAQRIRGMLFGSRSVFGG